jgi:hypothetical protein
LWNNTASEALIVADVDGAVKLYHDGSQKLATTSTGIDVTGSVTADGLVVDGASSGSTVATFTANANVDTPLLVFQRLGGAVAGKIAYDDTNTAITFGTTTNHEVRFLTNNTEKMQLTADGNLGIGITDPDQALEIGAGGKLKLSRADNARSLQLFSDNDFGTIETSNDPIKIASQVYTRFDVNGTERMRIDSSGNVGIGTSAPSASIDVVSSGTNGQSIAEFSSASGKRAQISTDAQDDAFMYLYDSADAVKVAFRTDGNASYINGGGNVGINTASPVATLHTVANAGTTGFLLTGAASNNIASFYTSGGSQAVTLDSSGNLLVGKTASGIANSGFEVGQSGQMNVTQAGATVGRFNRKTSDGSVLEFAKDGATVGSIGAISGDLVIGTGAVGLRYNNGASAVQPINSNGTANSGAIDLGSSGTGFKDLHLSGRAYINDGIKIDSGSGIYFGQDGNAANKLDDYEEGTWTVTSGVGLTITEAVYTKVGRVVHLVADITFASGSSSSADAALALPFSNLTVYSSGSLNYTTHSGAPAINVEGDFLKFRASVGGSALAYNNVGGHRFIFHATYFAA